MLRSKRFYAAVILLILLLICVTVRALRRADLPQDRLPALSSQTTAASQSVEIETTAESRISGTASTESVPLHSQTEPQQTDPEQPVPHADEPDLPAWKAAELRQKTDDLAASLPDFAGWIYLADSEIDYPVVQGTDNLFYLSHAPDGRAFDLGSIMLDFRNDRRFQDPASILYGHNMVSGMFGDIRSFREQESFDRHRYGWLYTPDAVYRIEFFALAVVSGLDPLYQIPEGQGDFLSRIRSQAEFDSGAEVPPDARLIALSTCTAADLTEARAVFTGMLEPYS